MIEWGGTVSMVRRAMLVFIATQLAVSLVKLLLGVADVIDYFVLVLTVVMVLLKIVAAQLEWRRDMNKLTGRRMDDV